SITAARLCRTTRVFRSLISTATNGTSDSSALTSARLRFSNNIINQSSKNCSIKAVHRRLILISATAGTTKKATSSSPRAFRLLLEAAEPRVRENVARTISRPTRRIHVAMRFHERPVVADLAATLAKITNQLFATFELRARRLVAIEIADQTNSECNVVEIIAVHVPAVDLPAPAI